MQTVIQRVIECQTKLDVRLKTPISYLISELVCNIDQHSDSRYGYIYTQYLQREHCLNIGIADDGITNLRQLCENAKNARRHRR